MFFMIIYDMSGLFFSCVHAYYARTKEPLDENTLRGMILNQLSFYNKKFGNHQNIVLAYDSAVGYWRKKHFQYYKETRKKTREESDIDWNLIFTWWNTIVDEFTTVLPYVSLRVDQAEADDIFATLCFRYSAVEETIIIVSSDEDSVQLQELYKNVKQFSLKRKAFITIENTKYDLFDHILRGDRGDGIPSVLSGENYLVEGIKQPSVTKKAVEEWRSKGGLRNPEKFCDATMLERFKTNRLIIDFGEIPLEIIDAIDEAYINFKTPKGKLFNYFIKHRLTNMMENFK
jgi:5'-3' exonuclease